MKIKYNNFLIIVPIFILIASVMSYLNYMNEVKEIKWGMQTKAKSFAIPSKIFIEEMLKKQQLDDVLEEIKPKIENILGYKQALRFYISKNQEILFDTADTKLEENFKIVQNIKKPLLGDVFSKGGKSRLSVHVPLENAGADLILSVETDVTDFTNRMDEAFTEIMYTIIVSAFFGFLTSYILSKIVTAKIYALNNYAKAISSGNYHHSSDIGKIHEFADLGDTLDILKSIMKEIVSKTKNIIIEDEKFRSDDDLIHTYHEVLYAPSKSTLKGITISINTLGYPEVGYFFKSFIHKDKLFAYLGKVNEEITSIETILKADAAQKYLMSKIQSNALELKKFEKMFNLNYLELIEVNKNSLHLDRLSEGIESKKSIDLKKGRIHLVCSENSLVKNRLTDYIQNYPKLSINDIIVDLPSLFANKANEVCVMIQKE